MRRVALPVIAAWMALGIGPAGQTPATPGGAPQASAAARPPDPTNLGTDASGNTMRKAPRTAHMTKYNEATVAAYTVPDPLVMKDGRRVASASMWSNTRRAEILNM